MALLGISILIASISFFCYKMPFRTWGFLSWISRPTIQTSSQREEDANPVPPGDTIADAPTSLEPPTFTLSDESPSASTSVSTSDKAQQDRRAMPPPPMFLKPSSSKATTSPDPLSPPDTPKASASKAAASHQVPNLNLLSDSDLDLMPPPQFPAANSSQRASNSRGPPRLNPLPPTLVPLRSPTLMSPPLRSPLPNRTPGLAPGAALRSPAINANSSSYLIPASTNTYASNNLSNTSVSTSPSSGGLFPPPTHSAPPSKPRKKVQLSPGHSPLDWATIQRDPLQNLSGLPLGTSYLKVPPSLLKSMNGRLVKNRETGEKTRGDAWTALSGKVYNITPYLPYHPGGEPELMRCAGKDGTKLFGEVHPWVNWEGMLEGCLVGILVSEDEAKPKASGTVVVGDGMEDMD